MGTKPFKPQELQSCLKREFMEENKIVERTTLNQQKAVSAVLSSEQKNKHFISSSNGASYSRILSSVQVHTRACAILVHIRCSTTALLS